MRILFFFVHPSKYHLFKYTINYLKSHGHTVDIAIISKDVLEELVKNEGWEYTNIFPEGRRSKSSNKYAILWSTGINFLKTIYRLFKFTKNKKYDLFITDDCLSIVGRFKKVPTIIFTDNELNTVPEYAILLKFSNRIFAPNIVHLKHYEYKKIGFNGYKEIAYLHPSYFTPDKKIMLKYNPSGEQYFFIRVVSMTASHDRGIIGLTNERIEEIIKILSPYGKIYISSERELPDKLSNYKLNIKAEEIIHIVNYSTIFIGDSGTMASEAAILGVPSIMFHDFIGNLKVMEEKENKYGLMYGFRCNEFDKMLIKLKELLSIKDLKKTWLVKKENMLKDKEDINLFFIKEIEKYKL